MKCEFVQDLQQEGTGETNCDAICQHPAVTLLCTFHHVKNQDYLFVHCRHRKLKLWSQSKYREIIYCIDIINQSLSLSLSLSLSHTHACTHVHVHTLTHTHAHMLTMLKCLIQCRHGLKIQTIKTHTPISLSLSVALSLLLSLSLPLSLSLSHTHLHPPT